MDDHGPQHAGHVRQVCQTDGKLLALRQMQRDVAAIVDIGAIELGALDHHAENLLRNGAGNRRHRRDEAIPGERRHRVVHAARHLAT